jgi:hypothetical protein
MPKLVRANMLQFKKQITQNLGLGSRKIVKLNTQRKRYQIFGNSSRFPTFNKNKCRQTHDNFERKTHWLVKLQIIFGG